MKLSIAAPVEDLERRLRDRATESTGEIGARIELENGDIVATAPEGLKGATIFLGGPNGSTVLGTANVMTAATLAKGRTIIECAACEPEVADHPLLAYARRHDNLLVTPHCGGFSPDAVRGVCTAAAEKIGQDLGLER